MKIQSLMITILFLSFGASLCLAKQAVVMITPPAIGVSGDTVECDIVNVSSETITVAVTLYDSVTGQPNNEQTITVAPNMSGGVGAQAGGHLYFCKFDGVKSTKARAAMHVFASDLKSYVSMPAN